ncbi:MAG: Ig-like domain-containing protein [Candidatus Poribacteria bacterium]
MKNFLRISALLTATLMVFIMVGCGGSDDETATDKVKPTLASSTPATGGTIASNGSVTLVFSEKMGSATVNGAAAVNSGDGKTWNWTGTLAAGAATLKVGGADVAGNKLDEVSISVTVTAPDTTAPDIDATSDPKNGATGVDPTKVTKMTIVFTEAMDAGIKIDAVEPADLAKQISPALSADGKSLVISFLGGFKLSNEMTVKITLIGKDKAGNALKTTAYTFATMKKEG